MSMTRKALIFVDDGYHELELFYPWYRFLEEAYECDIASNQIKQVSGKISSRQPSDLPFFVKEIMRNCIKNII